MVDLQGTIKNYKVTDKYQIKTMSGHQPMKIILKKLSTLFSNRQTMSSHSSLPFSRNPQYSMLHDGSETANRGQLVQVLLRDLVRKSGIPQGWIQCQIQVMNSRTRGQGIYVRLVVKQWDERLMKYAFAFQKTLLTEIVQFEPRAASWLQGIAWQLEVASSCPLTELPGPDFWKTPTIAPDPFDQFNIVPMPANPLLHNTLKPVPSPINVTAEPQDDTAQDLERLFAIRDNELANMDKDDLMSAGYESTEPSPLQKN